jgi:hypothetical protein
MLSKEQIEILNKNNVQAHGSDKHWCFTVDGKFPRQRRFFSEEDALLRAFEYLMKSKKQQ